MSKKPTTEGIEWLGHSMAAFNGSGYADRDDEESLVASYKAYKTMKNKPDDVRMITKYEEEALYIANILLKKNGPGRTVKPGFIERFSTYYPKAKNWLPK